MDSNELLLRLRSLQVMANTAQFGAVMLEYQLKTLNDNLKSISSSCERLIAEIERGE